MPAPVPVQESLENALRARLAGLTSHFRQSDMARKLGVSRVNICRYLKGNRIPAWVCAALAREFGVNPAWLLSGDGAKFIADDVAGNVETGALFKLLDAASAVARMSLGSLSGRAHAKALREFGETLATYTRLQDRVSAMCADTMRNLLGEWGDSINAGQFARAAAARKAATQLAPLVRDETLLTRLLGLQCGYELATGGNIERAIGYQMELVTRMLPGMLRGDTRALEQVRRLGTMLRPTGRKRQSIAVSRAALELAAISADAGEPLLLVRLVAATARLETGEVSAALDELAVWRQVQDDYYRRGYAGLWGKAMLLAGRMTMPEFVRFQKQAGANEESLMEVAVLADSAASIRAALRAYEATQLAPEAPAILPYVVCRALLAARSRPGAGALERADAGIAASAEAWRDWPALLFETDVYGALLANANGKPGIARSRLATARDRLHSLAPGVEPDLVPQCVFHKLGLSQGGKAAKGARQFFRRLVDRGGLMFRALAG